MPPVAAEAPTTTEQAAEACEQPEIVDEFGHGSVDYCYMAMLDEIAPDGRTRKLDRHEDGSGMLFVDGVPNWFFDVGTFPWDCHTQGNRICGTEILTASVLILPELPRTS